MRWNYAFIVYLHSTLHSGIRKHLCNSLQIISSFSQPVQFCLRPQQDATKLEQDAQEKGPTCEPDV